MEWNVLVIKLLSITNRQLSNGYYVGEGNVIPDLCIIPPSSLQNFDFFCIDFAFSRVSCAEVLLKMQH